MRQTASGTLRRDYLASQMVPYQQLVSAYLRNKQPKKALQTIELFQARLLSEQLEEMGVSQ